jgi:hypothetical protein
MSTPARTRYLCVYECSRRGHGFTVTIETEEGGGTRLLGAKCCPAQYELRLKRWPLTPEVLHKIRDELEL